LGPPPRENPVPGALVPVLLFLPPPPALERGGVGGLVFYYYCFFSVRWGGQKKRKNQKKNTKIPNALRFKRAHAAHAAIEEPLLQVFLFSLLEDALADLLGLALLLGGGLLRGPDKLGIAKRARVEGLFPQEGPARDHQLQRIFLTFLNFILNSGVCVFFISAF
jgi:hypothetical protein